MEWKWLYSSVEYHSFLFGLE